RLRRSTRDHGCVIGPRSLCVASIHGRPQLDRRVEGARSDEVMDWIGAHGKNQTGDPRRWARILDIVRYRRPAIPTSRRQSQRFCKTSPTPRTIRTALGGSIKETHTGALLEAESER